MYFGTKKIVEVGFELERPIKGYKKGFGRGFRGEKSFTSLFSLLEAIKIVLKSLSRATKA